MMFPCAIFRTLMPLLGRKLNTMKLRRPADSTLAAYCKDRNSARPAGSYRKNYTDFRRAWKVVTAAFG